MTDPSGECDKKILELGSEVEALKGLPTIEQVRAIMRSTSTFLETAAFEMASDQSPDRIAKIMRMAARLERAASDLGVEEGRGGACRP